MSQPKKRNVRKKIDDESDESDSPKPSVVKRPKPAPSTLSFDEDNDGAIFSVKKSKQSKQLKKSINQAPNVLQFVETNDDSPLISSGCSYSEKSLKELRNSQRFSSTPQIDETGGIVVITGELSEALDVIETLSWPSEEVPHPPVSPMEISTPPNNDENEQIWEDQLATRGGIKLSHLSSYKESIESKSRESRRSSSLVSIQQSLKQNIQSAQESCVRQNKQIDATRISLLSLSDEKSSSEQLLKVKASDLLFLQEFRLYVSDVVGMLRAKEPFVNDMHKAVLECIRPYSQKIEGLVVSSSDELYLDKDYDRFNKAAAVIMQDVRVEISQVSEILSHFQKFRQGNSPKYQATYVDLSLPKLVGPFVILDILPCLLDLVKGKTFQFSDRPWYDPLYDYSVTFPGDASSNNKELLPNVIIDIVLPFLTSSIEALLNPFDQKSLSVISQMILQILDFDPTPNQLSPLFNEIVEKFERTYESTAASPLQLHHLQNLLESLKIGSQILSPSKVSRLAWKYLHQFRSTLLQSLKEETNLSVDEQTTAYNMVVLILQNLLHLLQACVPLIRNDPNIPLDDSVALNSLVLEELDVKHSSLLPFRRSSLAMFLSRSNGQ